MSLTFNKVYVIESLAEETPTGRLLAQDLPTLCIAYTHKTGRNVTIRNAARLQLPATAGLLRLEPAPATPIQTTQP